jgi:hypothetical protein
MASETRARHRRGVESPLLAPWARTPAEGPNPPDARQRARRRSPGEQSSTCGASVYVLRTYAASGTACARAKAEARRAMNLDWASAPETPEGG